VREAPGESVLLLAARVDVDVVLDLPELTALYGSVAAERTDAGTRLHGTGPAFAAWSLPSPQLPPF